MDGGLCSGKASCTAGKCVAQPKECPSPGICKTASCDPKTGECVPGFALGGAPCQKEDICTKGSICVSGNCIGGKSNCQCKKDIDCLAAVTPNKCVGKWLCDKSIPGANVCRPDPASILACGKSGKEPCVVKQCQPSSGACETINAPFDPACDDGDKCTSKDACDGGACKGGIGTCDDGDDCTVDTCDKNGGCSHGPAKDGSACDDGDMCSVGDVCGRGWLVPRASCLVPVVSVDAGRDRACALMGSGEVMCWGDQAGPPKDIGAWPASSKPLKIAGLPKL